MRVKGTYECKDLLADLGDPSGWWPESSDKNKVKGPADSKVVAAQHLFQFASNEQPE